MNHFISEIWLILIIVYSQKLKKKNFFQISLGGDTDTIGSMTGAIAGAFYGEEKISNNLLQHCEASEEFKVLGDKLFEVSIAQ